MSKILKKKVEFMLPWAPSINNYYKDIRRKKDKIRLASYHKRDKRKNKALKKHVVKFFDDAYYLIKHQCGCTTKLHGNIKVDYLMCPPDNRKHDTGNLRKGLDDALWKSGLIEDDNDILQVNEKKIAPEYPGWIKVIVTEI